MINTALYESLCRVFDTHVAVVNEDDPGTFTCPTQPKSFIGRKNKRYAEVEDWGECYRLNCPACGDTRERLYISHYFGCKKKIKTINYYFGNVYVCHNERCNLQQYFDRLWQICPDCTGQEIGESRKPSTFVSFMNDVKKEMDLPSPCIPIISDEIPDTALAYLYERQFEPADLDKYKVKFVPKGTVYQKATEEEKAKSFLEDRLLIPIIQRHKMVSWQARRLRDTPGDKGFKYLFPKKANKSEWLYNMDTAIFHHDLVITEGVTDVWRIGQNAVALFGKKASRAQLELLKLLWGWNGSCVIALDPDAKSNAKKLADYFRSQKTFPKGVAVAEFTEGDPASYRQSELNEIIEEARSRCTN
ncbi:MAG: hypothetical protein ACXABY_10085 [Candidatus Thorarchaeota archaeon]|jgi:hypothetical protein